MRHTSLAVTSLLFMLLLLTGSLSAGTQRSAKADGNFCQLLVPANPLTAAGLATPWQLQQPCSESNTSQAVFVQAVIFDKDAKKLLLYNPLVVNAGTSPAITPVVPTLPPNADLAVFGGGNDDATTLIGAGAGSCVNGANGQVFGQVFFCGTAQLFADVNAAQIPIPRLGQGINNRPCPTVRDFRLVDQDQSDNIQTTYLVLQNGQTAQNTAANRFALRNYTILGNGSDNTLLTRYVDPPLGCHPWMIPDIGDGNRLKATQATDELQAAADQQAPVALVPAGDPMVRNDLGLLNAYRASVDQPVVTSLSQADTGTYCSHLKQIAPTFLAQEQALFVNYPSPAAGQNLYSFLENRLANTYVVLGCH